MPSLFSSTPPPGYLSSPSTMPTSAWSHRQLTYQPDTILASCLWSTLPPATPVTTSTVSWSSTSCYPQTCFISGASARLRCTPVRTLPRMGSPWPEPTPLVRIEGKADPIPRAGVSNVFCSAGHSWSSLRFALRICPK